MTSSPAVWKIPVLRPIPALRSSIPNSLPNMKLTHCDLFFADGAVLVEGTVEKLLLPEMITRVASGLGQRYLTVLEVGGAYAHRFAALLEFISVPYLVVTDIDSVDPTNKRSVCRADTLGAVSSNAAIAFFLRQSSIKALVELDEKAQRLESRRCYVAYQRPSIVAGYDRSNRMHGRTFEETFAYENLPLFRNESLSLGQPPTAEGNYEAEYKAIYDAVKAPTFKKTEFALSVASSRANWNAPAYITNGLKWLEGELRATGLIPSRRPERDGSCRNAGRRGGSRLPDK